MGIEMVIAFIVGLVGGCVLRGPSKRGRVEAESAEEEIIVMEGAP